MARFVRSPVAVTGILALVLVAACGSGATPAPSASPPPTPTLSAPPDVSPSAGPSASPASSTTYVVRKGDTLIAIAKRFHITLVALKRANPLIGDPTKLKIGAKLVIPAP
jgi:LysM repeat protein